MLVEDVMSRDVVTLSPAETLRETINVLRRKGIRHLPVVADAGLVGIVTDRDVKRATPSVLTGMSNEEYDSVLLTIKVAQFMTRDPITTTPKSPLTHVIRIFIEKRVGALPVVDNGRLVGIVTDVDVLRVALDLLDG
jgi:acetoin utilization protein AcuB